MLINNTLNVEVPEGIDLQAELAGPVVRSLAFSIDISIRFLLYFIVSIVFGLMGKAGEGGILITIFTLEWFYPVLFEVLNKGQTPGKKIFKLAVVNENLTPIRWEASIIRNLVRYADFLPFMYLSGVLSMLFNAQYKRLGDLAAGTVVIYKPVQQQHSLPNVSPQPLTQTLSLEEQKALVDFTYRYQQLSAARQQELAEIISPMVKIQDKSTVEQLHAMGLYLLGKK